jgi:alpha-mannosidase
MNVFRAKPYRVPEKAPFALLSGLVPFTCGELLVTLNADTGLIAQVEKNGKKYLTDEAMRITLFTDTEDAWAQRMFQHEKIGDKMGEFSLLSTEEGTIYSGVHQPLASCRIIEDGEVRTIVEAVFGYGLSRAVMRYTFPKAESFFGVNALINCAEKDKCLKLAIPTGKGVCMGQKAFGREPLSDEGCEDVFNDWCGVYGDNEGLFAVAEGTYAMSYNRETLYLNLLRTAAYTGHPIYDRPLVPQDRYTDRFDLGERSFRFVFSVNTCDEAEKLATRERETPVVFSFFPKHTADVERKSLPFITLSNDTVELSAMLKLSSGHYLVRLYNASDKESRVTVEIPLFGLSEEIILPPFTFRTYETGEGVFGEIPTDMR